MPPPIPRLFYFQLPASLRICSRAAKPLDLFSFLIMMARLLLHRIPAASRTTSFGFRMLTLSLASVRPTSASRQEGAAAPPAGAAAVVAAGYPRLHSTRCSRRARLWRSFRASSRFEWLCTKVVRLLVKRKVCSAYFARSLGTHSKQRAFGFAFGFPFREHGEGEEEGTQRAAAGSREENSTKIPSPRMDPAECPTAHGSAPAQLRRIKRRN